MARPTSIRANLEIVDGKGMQPAQADSGGSVAPSRDQWTFRRFMIVLPIFPVVRPIVGLREEKTMLVFYCRHSGIAKAFVLGQVCEPKQAQAIPAVPWEKPASGIRGAMEESQAFPPGMSLAC